MKISLYLHKDIVDILSMYGDLTSVVNAVLDECASGRIDLQDKPPCRPRDGAGRYNVIVDNEYYESMVDMFGIKSKNISVRRLLYWFVENEVYNDLEWVPIKDYEEMTTIKTKKMIENLKLDVRRLKSHIERNVLNGMNVVNEIEKLLRNLEARND